jgi:1,3-beta-glucanosyltransferase GAS5
MKPTLLKLLLIITFLSRWNDALNPVMIKGFKFFDTVTKKELWIQGVDYNPRPNQGLLDRDSIDLFTDRYRNVWQRDLPYLKQLGVNAVRLKNLDPSQNHDAFICALDQAGIYAFVEISSLTTWNSASDATSTIRNPIIAAAPNCYPSELKNRGQAILREFTKYSNTLAFFIGHESSHTDYGDDTGSHFGGESTDLELHAPCIKKLLRDMRHYIASCSTIRSVPVGLISTISNLETFMNYFSCQGDTNDPFEEAEWYGINVHLYCDKAVSDLIDGTGLFILKKAFTKYKLPIPALITEYGCLSQSFGTSKMQNPGQGNYTLFDTFMSDPGFRNQYSGVFASMFSTEYQPSIESNNSSYTHGSFGIWNYGLGCFEPKTCDDIQIPCTYRPLPNFWNLQRLFHPTLEHQQLQAITMEEFKELTDRPRNTSKCPQELPPISHFKWDVDKRADLPCSPLRSHSNFSCSSNRNDLSFHDHHDDDKSDGDFQNDNYNLAEGTILFSLVSILALLAGCFVVGMEEESELRDTNQDIPNKHRQYSESVETTQLISRDTKLSTPSYENI